MDDKTKLDITLEEPAKKEISKIEEAPQSFGSWLNLNLSPEKLQEIVDNIITKIDKIEEDRKPRLEKIKEYRNQYDQIVQETSLPYPGCFNLCVPLTLKNVDACVSQTEEAFEDVDPKWTIMTPPDKNLIEARDTQEKILDYYSDTEMEDLECWTKVYHDAFLLGTGWLCMVFKREFIKVRDYVEYDSLPKFQSDYPNDWQKYPKYVEALTNGKTVKLVVEYNQEVCRSAKPEHAKWEDIYVPLETEGLQGMLKARIIARYVPKRWEEIYIDETKGDYIKGVSETLKRKMGSDGNLSEDIDPEYLKKVYDTFEVQYFVDIDNDNIEERCLFNIEIEHKLGLRAIRYPYNHSRPYVIPYYIQSNNSGIYQKGLGEKLQNLNIALNAILNHTLNSSVIANSLSLKVRSGSDAIRALYEHQWYPGSILELMNPDDVSQFNFATPNLSGLINLFAIVERFGEDVSGIVNYTIGQESAQDPEAPASKTIALMRKAEIKLRSYIKCLKRSNNEAGYQALRLIYQYVPKSRIAKILGLDKQEVDGKIVTVSEDIINQKIIDIFQYPLKAITQSSGFAIERMFAKRDNMEILNILMKDPIVSGDPKRRVVAYRILAKDWGSNWDKKIEYIVPTVDELQKEEQQANQDSIIKKQEFLKQATQEALNKGASPEEAKQIAIRASQQHDLLSQQQQAQAESAKQHGRKPLAGGMPQ